MTKEEKDKMFPLGLPLLEPIPGTRNYRMGRDFIYRRRDGREIFIPEGFVTDGASIPAAFWLLVGDPFAPDHICAAVVHDWLWRLAQTWRAKTQANRVFAEILKRQGVVGAAKRCELRTGVWLGKVWWWVWK
jgi:hypothetical protein